MVLPLLATQILWINLVTDGAPALALGLDPADDTLMEQPPRPAGEGVLTARMWRGIVFVGAIMAAGTLFVLDASLPNNPQYLFHGGHLWDQTYALANLRITPNYIDGGYAVIDLNAMEAISEGVVPEPSALLLLFAGVAAAADDPLRSLRIDRKIDPTGDIRTR